MPVEKESSHARKNLNYKHSYKIPLDNIISDFYATYFNYRLLTIIY